jgi:hypothetical protein
MAMVRKFEGMPPSYKLVRMKEKNIENYGTNTLLCVISAGLLIQMEAFKRQQVIPSGLVLKR